MRRNLWLINHSVDLNERVYKARDHSRAPARPPGRRPPGLSYTRVPREGKPPPPRPKEEADLRRLPRIRLDSTSSFLTLPRLLALHLPLLDREVQHLRSTTFNGNEPAIWNVLDIAQLIGSLADNGSRFVKRLKPWQLCAKSVNSLL